MVIQTEPENLHMTAILQRKDFKSIEVLSRSKNYCCISFSKYKQKPKTKLNKTKKSCSVYKRSHRYLIISLFPQNFLAAENLVLYFLNRIQKYQTIQSVYLEIIS